MCYKHECTLIPSLTHSKSGDEGEDKEECPHSSLWISEKSKEMIRITNKHKQTCLHLAAENGHDK